MNLTVESFRAAAMASIKNNDGSLDATKDATISVKTSKGQTKLVSAKPTSRSSVQANQAARQQFCDALKADSRFSGMGAEIDRLVKFDGDAQRVSTKPLNARTIVSVLKTLTKDAGFEGLLADKGVIHRCEEEPSGFVNVQTMSSEDVDRLKQMLPKEVQQAYLNEYVEAMYSGSSPDFHRMTMLSDSLWMRLEMVNDRVKAGKTLFNSLVSLNCGLRGDLAQKLEATRIMAVDEIVHKVVPSYTYLSKKGGYYEPTSDIAKILRACIESFCKANSDLISAGYSLKNADDLMAGFVDTIRTAESYVIIYEDARASVSRLVESNTAKYGLDPVKSEALKRHAESILWFAINDVNEKTNGDGNVIRDIFHPEGKSFYAVFEADLSAEAEKLAQETKEQYVRESVQNVIANSQVADFERNLAMEIHQSFGNAIELGSGAGESSISPVSREIQRLVEEDVLALYDNGKGERGVLEDDALHNVFMRQANARNTVKKAGQIVNGAKGELAEMARQKVGGILFGAGVNKNQLKTLEESFLKGFNGSPTLRKTLGAQVTYVLEHPFDDDACEGFVPAMRKFADETVARVGTNCGTIRTLIAKGSEKIASFLAAKPDGTPYGITADQQQRIREDLNTALLIELDKCVSNPEGYDAETECATQIRVIEDKIDKMQAARANAFQAAARSTAPAEGPGASGAPAEVQQKPARSFTKEETKELEREIKDIRSSLTWPEEGVPLHAELLMPFQGAIETYLRGFVKTSGSSVESLKTQMRDLAPKLWQAGQETLVNFARLMDEALKQHGVDRIVNITGKRDGYAPWNSPDGEKTLNPLARAVLDVSTDYFKRTIFSDLSEGKPTTPEQMKRDIEAILGGENGFLAQQIATEKNWRTSSVKTKTEAILTDLSREIGCDSDSAIGKTLRSVLNDFSQSRLTDENRYWMPANIATGCRELVDRFVEFRDRIANELNAKLVGNLADLPTEKRIQYVDNMILDALDSVRKAPDGKKLAAFEKVLRSSVAGMADNIVAGVGDYLEDWRGRPATEAVDHPLNFVTAKFSRDWVSGSFIQDLGRMKVKGAPSAKELGSLAQTFSKLSSSTQGMIAHEIRDAVAARLNDFAKKKAYPTNQELAQIIHGIEVDCLSLIRGARRVSANCENVLKAKGVLGTGPIAVAPSLDALAPDSNEIDYLQRMIDGEIAVLLGNRTAYEKDYFSFFGDKTSSAFEKKVDELVQEMRSDS